MRRLSPCLVLFCTLLPALLVASGAYAVGESARTPLGSAAAVAKAAEGDDTEKVLGLARAGGDVNEADEKGNAPLIYAAFHGNAAMTKALLESGARPNVRDKIGNTPMHLAAQRGSLEVMTLLLAAHLDADLHNKEGVTPLMLAAGGGHVEAMKLLLKSGADPQRQDFTGRDAASWAASKPAALRVLRERKGG